MTKRFSPMLCKLLIGLAIFSTPKAAKAAHVYTFEFDQATYSASPNEMVNVGIYLREEVTNSETPRLATGGADGGDGLFSFKFQVDFSQVSGGLPGSNVNSVDDILVDREFLRDDRSLSFGIVQLAGSENPGIDTDGEFGVNGEVISPTEYRVKLAEIGFTAGGQGTETTLALSTYPDVFLSTGFADFTVIDSSANFSSSNIVVSAVPEPSAILLLAAGNAFCLLRRRRN